MFRPLFLLRSTVPMHVGRVRPYHRVLQAMEQGGQGLSVAAEVFKEFELSCRNEPIHDNKNAPLSSTGSSATPRKPLTEFCGDAKDVEPLTILLLKALCDLRRLDEMRFLFTQSLLELDSGIPLSIELFNVYLLAISMTETYSLNEVENVIELIRCKGATPDIITKLSVFILHLRLGQDSCISWWKVIRAEVQEIISGNAVPKYPLLPLRVQNCFQTLMRLHHDVVVLHECFDLLRTLRPEGCTPALLLPYMMLSVANEAAPPSTVVDILKIHEASRGNHREGPTAVPLAGSHADTASSAPSNPAAVPADPPLLNSESTVFRLLSKCLRWGDADAARYVCEYLKNHHAFRIIAEEHQPLVSLLYAGALARAGCVLDSLGVLEGVPPPRNRPGRTAGFFNGRRRLVADSVDAVGDVVRAIGERGVGEVLRELRTAAGAGRRVTAASLDLLLAACAMRDDDRLGEGVLSTYPSFGAAPSCFTYTALLSCYAAEGSAFRGVDRLRSVRRAMADRGIPVDDAFLRETMRVALSAGDLACALVIAEQHAELQIPMDTPLCACLLEKLTVAVDVDGARRALRAMRSCKASLDTRSLALCTATFEKWGIKCDDLANL
ncbi:unnamed protein product [Phytomonas sp. EM1]|nr:unnamed protein product [Phytomonas sp. EM1]|eukprot:CCW61540.1 unnamed protein product [Phytomonas sp. isolate EM1]